MQFRRVIPDLAHLHVQSAQSCDRCDVNSDVATDGAELYVQNMTKKKFCYLCSLYDVTKGLPGPGVGSTL